MNFPNTPRNAARSEADDESTTGMQRTRQLRCVGTATVEAVAFWAAVVLPLPTLYAISLGVGSQTELLVISGLLTTNLAAFYVGHDYSRPEAG